MEPAYSKRSKKNHLLPSEEYYREILSKHISLSDPNYKVFFDALSFSYTHHSGIFRKSGEPYVNHPVAVAEILINDIYIRDPELLSAALLHDVVEDVDNVTLQDIEVLFGDAVANLVDGCTKLNLQQKDRATQSDLTHSKIFLSARKQLGVLLIKLADRLHNMQTLGSLPEPKRRRIAFETLRVYAPIAAKLNLYCIKRNLYNLALTYLFPRKSKKILNITRELLNSAEVGDIHKKLQEILSQTPYSFSIRHRVKGLGSYYSHSRQTIDINNAENLIDFTVVLNTDDSLACYLILGHINQFLKPIPKSIRDMVANPKPNGYQSLHVRINVQGRDYLIKIRTREMDLNANSGMRYQWDSINIQESYWGEISDLLRSIGEYGGAGSQRKDLIQLSDTAEIFAYTPNGDIHYFPRGSIVLDFAYKIHSDLGDNCEGAFINGRRVSPLYKIKDGDTVEIIKSDNPIEVDSDLERQCMTPRARSGINKLLQKRRQSYAKIIGKNILLQDINRFGLSQDILKDETFSLIQNLLHIKDQSQMFIRIGQDALATKLIFYYFDQIPEFKAALRTKSQPAEYRNHLFISEIEKAVHKFSNCCKPYPGLLGVVATLSERGVAFHRPTCNTLFKNNYSGSQQFLEVKWDLENNWSSPMVFQLRARGLSLQEFITTISPNVSSFHLHRIEKRPSRLNIHSLSITILLKSLKESSAFFQNFSPGSVYVKSFGRKDIVETL